MATSSPLLVLTLLMAVIDVSPRPNAGSVRIAEDNTSFISSVADVLRGSYRPEELYTPIVSCVGNAGRLPHHTFP